MFENHSCNLHPWDSSIRFILASLIAIYAFYFDHLYLLLLSIFFFYTAYKKFCFLYYFVRINDRLSINNYYSSLLPKYRTTPVFIFNSHGKIIFQNASAEYELPNIVNATDLRITDLKTIIENSLEDVIIFEHNEQTYQAEIRGVKSEKLILVYFSDVTELMELNEAIEETQREVIYAMGEIGETRSKETGHHVKRVALYSKELALLYGLSEEEANKLHMASPMHDIGKVGIQDAILNAPRKLDADEFEIMKTHAKLGYDMLKHSNKPILQAAAIVASEHHEKWDGSGYPNATKGENIHIYGRITAIADVFDALGSDRVYKKAWSLEDILELFENEKGKHFDPKLVELFLNNLNRFLLIRDKFKD